MSMATAKHSTQRRHQSSTAAHISSTHQSIPMQKVLRLKSKSIWLIFVQRLIGHNSERIGNFLCALSALAGLSFSEAGKLSNYLHFHEPKCLRKLSILEMAESDPCRDFLNPVSEDIPKGMVA